MVSWFLPESLRLWLFGTWSVKRAPNDKTALEMKLEMRGNLKELQLYRYQRFHHLLRDGDEDQSNLLLKAESLLRETFQREITLKEKLAKAMTNKDENKDSESRAIRNELDVLNQRYWLLERDWWCRRSSFSEGPLTRAFNLWRSHPRWYMHRVLVDDCAGRGGCCSRDCGCCLGREINSARKLGLGHCTSECGCCSKSRGFLLTPEQKKSCSLWFELSEDQQDTYYHLIVMASIWGLWQGSQDSPFDLIDESATVNHKIIPCMGLAYVENLNSAYLSDEDDESTSTELLL